LERKYPLLCAIGDLVARFVVLYHSPIPNLIYFYLPSLVPTAANQSYCTRHLQTCSNPAAIPKTLESIQDSFQVFERLLSRRLSALPSEVPPEAPTFLYTKRKRFRPLPRPLHPAWPEYYSHPVGLPVALHIHADMSLYKYSHPPSPPILSLPTKQLRGPNQSSSKKDISKRTAHGQARWRYHG
jgi:hypothetical protein